MTTAPAIQVSGLGKHYRLGATVDLARTFREVLAAVPTHLGRNARRWTRRMIGYTTIAKRATAESASSDLFWALRDVDFAVQPGEVVGIIGRNGAGKSTLLKILARITTPTTGRAELRGRIGSLLEVGTGFNPELTGRENIFLNGSILGMRRAEVRRKLDDIVAFAETEQFLDTPVKRYSSGMRVRLAFAVAAHLEPEILIIDEVLAVGDMQFQNKCLGKMGDVARGGRTVLFVSHNMPAVRNLCDRAVLLDRGRVLFDGACDEAISRYAHLNRGQTNQREPGVFDLAGRENPCIDGPPIIQGMTLLGPDDAPQNRFPMGGPLTVDVDVGGMNRHRGALIALIVKSSVNQWVCSINSGMSGRYADSVRAEDETARLHVPIVRLTPGRYSIDLSVAQKGCGRVDYVEDAGTFDVLDGDVYGNGYQVTGYFGVFYVDGTWVIRNRK
ncbi:MAG: ABC transporter ATP-binding protein [bacterium]|nr:ABC transporter ATP-binding protein [bacterium]